MTTKATVSSISTPVSNAINPQLAAMQAQIDKLNQENAALKARPVNEGRLSVRVSQKGAIAIYGLGKFPVTLYAGQMRRLLAIVPTIEQFMKDNGAQLTEKPVIEKPAASEAGAKTVSF